LILLILIDFFLHLVEHILEQADEVILPVKKIWRALQINDGLSDIEVPALTEFVDLLRNDDRFQFMHPLDYTEMFTDLNEEERMTREIEMEEAGFYSGERIKLKRVVLTGELLARMIERSSDRMMKALANAWETQPMDADGEQRLRAIIEKAQRLQRDVQRIVKQIREKDAGDEAEA
jgi:hypothetical protein